MPWSSAGRKLPGRRSEQQQRDRDQHREDARESAAAAPECAPTPRLIATGGAREPGVEAAEEAVDERCSRSLRVRIADACGFSSVAHSAGVSVSASTAENAIEIASVTENCR